MIKKLFIILLFLCFSTPTLATTYWISPTGAAANLAACAGETPLSGTDACSYDKANGPGVAAGDTVYYRAGSYTGITGDFINPYNTGTAGNVITFSSYDSEDVQVTGSGKTCQAVNLNSDSGTVRSYIKVNDIHFNNFYKHLWILKGTHNEVSNSSFIGYPASMGSGDFEACGSYIHRQAQYNWIHDNTFAKYGYAATYGSDVAGTFCMGRDDTDENVRYNIVEDNIMYAGGHHVAYLNGSYNIYRNNYFHNEPWYPITGSTATDEELNEISTPTFATRVVSQGSGDGDGSYNLNEGNRIGYGGPKNKNEIGGNTTQLMGGHNIWRYNVWAQSYLAAIWLYSYNGNQTDVQYNKIYNNTFWKGGYGKYQDYYDPSATAPENSWAKSYHHPVNIENDEVVANNTFKNNLFYQNNTNGTYAIGSYYDFVTSEIDSYSATGPNRQTISNNWTDDLGDPKFVDISAEADATVDPTTLWNFNLQSSSTAIDAGTYLTQADGSGTDSTTLVVDANTASFFFYDAGAIATAWPTANVNNDQICIGTVSNCVAISSINYATDTITLAEAKTWADNAPVWLYKKSDGTQVLRGTAPEYGAFEYNGNDLVVTIAGTGTCTVTSSPAGVNSTTTVTQNFISGTEVTLTATAAGGSTFVEWSGTGGCTGSSTCVLTVDGTNDAATATCNITGGTTGSMATGTTGSVGLSASGTGSITIVP